MLRRTSTVLVFNPAVGPAHMCGVPNNDNMDELIRYVKHAKKLRQFFGSHFQRIPDREAYYGAYGGPRGGRFTIRRTTTKRQYYHHNATHGKFAIHSTNTTNAYSGVGTGGMYRNIWDNQVCGTNSFWDVTFKMNAKDLSKDKSVEWMEGWGAKYKLLDEYTQPKMEDLFYQKHALYAHNFPWIKDPDDADYQWKGDDKIDYKDHGASTKSLANEFRSLWGIPEAPAPVAVPAASKKAPAAKKAASTSAKKDAKKDEAAPAANKKA